MPHANKSSDVPYGKGSLYNHLVDAQIRTQQRAAKLNQGIDAKLTSHNNMMKRHQNAELDRREKASKRIQRHIKELIAYQQFLEDFRVSNFLSLEPGFSNKRIMTPNTYRCYKTERRVMNVGFSLKSLHSQVKETIERNAPERKREQFVKRQLEAARKRSNFLIDRKVTNEAVNREKRLKQTDSGRFISLSAEHLENLKEDFQPEEPEELKTLKYKDSETVVTVHRHVDDISTSPKKNVRIASEPRGLKPRPIVIGTFKK